MNNFNRFFNSNAWYNYFRYKRFQTLEDVKDINDDHYINKLRDTNIDVFIEKINENIYSYNEFTLTYKNMQKWNVYDFKINKEYIINYIKNNIQYKKDDLTVDYELITNTVNTDNEFDNYQKDHKYDCEILAFGAPIMMMSGLLSYGILPLLFNIPTTWIIGGYVGVSSLIVGSMYIPYTYVYCKDLLYNELLQDCKINVIIKNREYQNILIEKDKEIEQLKRDVKMYKSFYETQLKLQTKKSIMTSLRDIAR